MPIHDWTRVTSGIFHHFHQAWIAAISNALNAGLLPTPYYALAEQIAGGLGPDVLALEAPEDHGKAATATGTSGGIALAESPPKVRSRAKAETDVYADKADAVVIRHASDHRIIAMLEIVSPGNKDRASALRKFVDKAEEVLRAAIHLLIVDLFPPGRHDPGGMHRAIWDRFDVSDPYVPPAAEPLTLAAYIGSPEVEYFVEPTAVGASLVEMPLFLESTRYIPAPLDATYQTAWDAVPAVWRKVLAAEQPPAK